MGIAALVKGKKITSSNMKLASFSPMASRRFPTFGSDQGAVDAVTEPTALDFVETQQELTALRQRNEELSHLVDVLPNGVVVLDNKGQVRQANQVAINLLGEPLEGEKWRTVITRSFRRAAMTVTKFHCTMV